jgi:hypothetical protein
VWKPGAEKVCSLLQLRPAFAPDQATQEMAGNAPGLFAYVCWLVNQEQSRAMSVLLPRRLHQSGACTLTLAGAEKDSATTGCTLVNLQYCMPDGGCSFAVVLISDGVAMTCVTQIEYVDLFRPYD